MTFNKIPLAIGYDPATGNASGLTEFVLNLSDVGDVCSAVPAVGQVLAFSGTSWCASTVVTGGGGGGTFTCSDLSACHPSSLSGVCSTPPIAGQVLHYNGSEYCPSTIIFPSASASLPTGNTGDILVVGEGDSAFGAAVASGDLFDQGIAAKQIATVTSGDAVNFPNGLQSAGSGLIPQQTSLTPGDVLIVPQGQTTFNNHIGSGALFDAGIAVKQIATVTSGATTNFPNGIQSGGNNLIPQQTSLDPGDILIVPQGATTFTNHIASGDLFDAGISVKQIATVTSAATTNFPNGVQSGGNNLIPQQTSLDPGDILIVPQGATTFTNHIASGDLFDAGIAVKQIATVTSGATTNFPNGIQSGGSDLATEAELLSVSNALLPSSVAGNDEIYYKNGSSPDGLATTTGSRHFITDVVYDPTDLTPGMGLVYTGDADGQGWALDTGTGGLGASVKAPGNKTGQAGTITANSLILVSGTSVSATREVSLGTDSLAFLDDDTTLNIKNLNVKRVGQMNPTTYIQEADWITPGAAANGFGSSQTGTGAGFGQCFDNDVMHPDKGTFGVYEIRSGSDTYGRAFLTTFNNAIAVSSCAISFTSRIAPSGLWVAGANDGRMCFGLRNGTSNAEATYAMEFQYGQGTGGGGTTWSAVVTDNSNSTVSDTGVTVAAQDFQVLQVSCNENWQNVDFYVSGVLKASFNLADHHIPDSRYNRLGAGWAIRNANSWSTSNQNDGNEIFLDWHQLRMTHADTTRGRDLIQ